MHFLKQAALMSLVAALAATTAASPAPIPAADVAPSAEVTPIVLELEPRAALVDHQAVVNTYSGDTCNGSNAQFTVTGAGASVCHAVSFPVRSIQVSASGCTTTTWSGSNCQGSSKGIPNSSCYGVLYASVSVRC